MCRASHSKLANPESENAFEISTKHPLFNGKKRLTGHSESNTRARHVESREKLGAAGSGTPCAIIDKVLSPSINQPPASQVTRARPEPNDRKIGQFTVSSREDAAERPITKIERSRYGRRSTALRLGEVRNIMAAAVFTAAEHRPLNRHTTIHFEAAGIADPVTALRRYTKLARDWLRTQGASFAYIWVREAGDGKGEHAHLLMHVPPHLSAGFARHECGWRKRIGATRALGAFRSTPVGRSYRHAEAGIQYGQSYSDHLAEIVGYLVKGAEPEVVKALGLTRVAPGGELWGKRSGMSENIGRAARRRAQ